MSSVVVVVYVVVVSNLNQVLECELVDDVNVDLRKKYTLSHDRVTSSNEFVRIVNPFYCGGNMGDEIVAFFKVSRSDKAFVYKSLNLLKF